MASSRVGTSTRADGLSLAGPVDQRQRRQRERGGLAGAGGRLADEVVAGDEVRDGLALDGGGLLVAEVLERLEQFRAQAECGEPVLGGSGHLDGDVGNDIDVGVRVVFHVLSHFQKR